MMQHLGHRYVPLGSYHAPRRAAYRALFEGCVTDEQTASIRGHLAARCAYGSDRFGAAIERHVGRLMQVTPAAVPPRSENDSEPFFLTPVFSTRKDLVEVGKCTMTPVFRHFRFISVLYNPGRG